MASSTDWRVPLWPDHSKSPTAHPSPPGAALNDEALFALPYAGQLAGVSRSAPTHAVFAMFDPSTMGLRFVKGDGTFVEAAEVLFTVDFKDLSEPSYGELLMRKRSNELWVKSKVYYHKHVSLFPMVRLMRIILLFFTLNNFQRLLPPACLLIDV